MFTIKRSFSLLFAASALAVAALPFAAHAGGDCCAPQKAPAAVCCKDKATCCATPEACCKTTAQKASCCTATASCCADKQTAKKNADTKSAKPMGCCSAKSGTNSASAPAHKH